MVNKVTVLKSGKFETLEISVYAPASITLISSKVGDVLVDAGSIKDKQSDLQEGLKKVGKSRKDIDNIVLTHNHPDHTGLIRVINKHARVYGPDSQYSLSRPDFYDSPCTDEYELLPGIKIIKTGGHETPRDQSVLVETRDGLVAIVGDLFLTEEEYRKNEFNWPPNHEVIALDSRERVYELKPRAVVPGHGPMFSV